VLNILFVEDNYLLAKGTARLLQQLGGHQVEVTNDPGAIGPLCKAKKIDLLLIDVKFLGGLFYQREIHNATLTKFLQTNPQTSDIPVIWVTSYDPAATQTPAIAPRFHTNDICPQSLADYPQLLHLIERTATACLN
jgi:two-component system, cell cycle response regulator DivK